MNGGEERDRVDDIVRAIPLGVGEPCSTASEREAANSFLSEERDGDAAAYFGRPLKVMGRGIAR